MKVKDCVDYDKEIPEDFPWISVEQVELKYIATEVALLIKHYLRIGKSHDADVLRTALDIISDYAKIFIEEVK